MFILNPSLKLFIYHWHHQIHENLVHKGLSVSSSSVKVNHKIWIFNCRIFLT
jgi:hypothetical protein